MESRITLIIHIDKAIDREALVRLLPSATAQAMTVHLGGAVSAWEDAYRRIRGDWNSYWADLDLNGDESLQQWREGRWRVVRALFRLTDRKAPDNNRISFYLDDLPREIGRACPILNDTFLIYFAKRYKVILISPYLEGGLIRGMLDTAEIGEDIQVIGPDELEQAGLKGVSGRWFASRMGITLDSCILASEHTIKRLLYVDSFVELVV